MTYTATAATTPRRSAERARYDARTVHHILDEALVSHLGFVSGGQPQVLPTLHVRIGDVLYLHGSTGSSPLLAAAGPGGLPVCVTVTLIDGLVMARSAFHHSVNYRSVVAHGNATVVTDPRRKKEVLAALVEHIAAGRSGQCRPPSAKELAATAVLALPLEAVSAKQRTGGVNDDEADLTLPYWAGVVPLRLVPQARQSTVYERSPWHRPVTLAGRHVRLEPLSEAHAAGLFAASRDPEVWRWLWAPQPQSADEMTAIISARLGSGMVCWAQLDATSGIPIGMTSYYDVSPADGQVAIGGTWIGRPWWRTGVNTEAKLMLLRRAFDELGAIRVTWHTDIHNERSQAAIARLGATREAVLRAHRVRPDGSLRDTVQFAMTADEWPAARARLTAAL